MGNTKIGNTEKVCNQCYNYNLLQLCTVVFYKIPVPIAGILYDPLLACKVAVHHSKAFGITLTPFKIVC